MIDLGVANVIYTLCQVANMYVHAAGLPPLLVSSCVSTKMDTGCPPKQERQGRGAGGGGYIRVVVGRPRKGDRFSGSSIC